MVAEEGGPPAFTGSGNLQPEGAVRTGAPYSQHTPRTSIQGGKGAGPWDKAVPGGGRLLLFRLLPGDSVLTPPVHREDILLDRK